MCYLCYLFGHWLTARQAAKEESREPDPVRGVQASEAGISLSSEDAEMSASLSLPLQTHQAYLQVDFFARAWVVAEFSLKGHKFSSFLGH